MENKKKADKPADEALHAEKAQVEITFEDKVNKYGFIFLDRHVQAAWGITKGIEQAVTIELTAEGALIVRKA